MYISVHRIVLQKINDIIKYCIKYRFLVFAHIKIFYANKKYMSTDTKDKNRTTSNPKYNYSVLTWHFDVRAPRGICNCIIP